MNEVRSNTNEEEIRLVANQCPEHKDTRHRTNPYRAYGKYALKFIKRWEDNERVIVIDPTIAEPERLGDWLYLELPIIIPCGICDRLTLHTFVSGKGWISVPPEGWRSRVGFQWDQEVPQNMKNVYSTSLSGLSGKSIRIRLVRGGNDLDVVDPHREPFHKVVQTYLFGSEREFLVRFKDLLQTTLNELPDYYTRRVQQVMALDGEAETLADALRFAIREIEETKQIIKSAKLGEIRSRLQSALATVAANNQRMPWRRYRLKLQ